MSEAKQHIAAIPTHVKASVDKDGRERPAHIATRHRRVAVSDEPAPDPAHPVDAFIIKHGGRQHFRETLDDMTADQRAKIIDAMAHVGGCTTADVMKRLGIHEPESGQDQAEIDELRGKMRERLAAAREEGVISAEEHERLTGILESEGVEAVVAAAAGLRPEEPATEAAQKEELPVGTLERAPETAAAAESPAAAAEVPTLEVAGPADINTRDQANTLYDKHTDLQNKAVRQRFEIEKRVTRGWRVPAAFTENAEQWEREAAQALVEWRSFCETNGIPCEE